MRLLSPAELAELAVVIKPRYRALVRVGGYSGLRIREMAGLRRGRVDVLRSRIEVVEKIVEVRGELLAGGPKTRAGRRQVPLPRPVAEELALHLERFVAPEPDALVFAGPDGGALRGRHWRARHRAPAITEAGLAPLQPHDLRRTAVALWIAQGASPKQIATWAGHTSVSVVLDRYGHLFPGHEDAVMQRLAEGYTAPVAPAQPRSWPTIGREPTRRASRMRSVAVLSADAQRLLDDVGASARLEGQELPPEDLELARAYLAGEIDAATFQNRVRRLVDEARRPAQSVRSHPSV